MRLTPCIALLACALLARPAAAQTPRCDALDEGPRAVAAAVMAAEHPYDCCDDTIAACVRASPACTLPRRLADHVCRLAAEGRDEATIRRALQRRALTMMRPGRVLAVDVSETTLAGAPRAPVRLVAYLCLRCPFCAQITPKLHREVTAGRLRGKATLAVRLFPIKGHPGSTEANMAAQAAHAQGRFWEYLLHAYARFDDFSVDALPAWAAAAGLDVAAFSAALEDAAVRARLVTSKREGLRNGVEGTPTFLLNGRPVVADMDLETLVDLCEEEHEALGSAP